MENYYKTLLTDGTTMYGYGQWEIPNGKPSEWMPKIEGDLVPCKNGYHLCRAQDLLKHLAPVICVAEVDGEVVVSDDKVVCRRARLVRTTDWNVEGMVSWSADVAEHVLHVFESQCPNDDRPRKAIELAGQHLSAAGYAAGDAGAAGATEAAWDAAWAAEAAAGDAGRAADAGYAAGAAEAAARAAWDAAWAAAGAARAAAGAAAGAAGRAADAAEAAAGYARDAAGYAEQQWQINRLCELAGIDKPAKS